MAPRMTWGAIAMHRIRRVSKDIPHTLPHLKGRFHGRMINSAGLELIKEYEGLRLEAYLDGVGVPSIGYGHTHGVKMGDTCSQFQADEWLEQDLITAENAVSKYVKVPLTDNQFAALVSFTFNEGEARLSKSTLLKKLNDGHYDLVPDSLRSWVFAGGVVEQGLVKRRNAEAALWNKP